MDDNLKRSLRRVTIQTMHKGAQRVAEFRRFWESWPPEERATFKAAVDKVIALNHELHQVPPRIALRLEICEQTGDDEFNTLSLTPSVLKQAIECWERGETFAPKGIFAYCG